MLTSLSQGGECIQFLHSFQVLNWFPYFPSIWCNTKHGRVGSRPWALPAPNLEADESLSVTMDFLVSRLYNFPWEKTPEMILGFIIPK
jgi:hypothetical protein